MSQMATRCARVCCCGWVPGDRCSCKYLAPGFAVGRYLVAGAAICAPGTRYRRRYTAPDAAVGGWCRVPGAACSCRHPTKYKRTGPQENDLPLDVVWIDIDYMDRCLAARTATIALAFQK
jgi:hypothetical protein